MDIIKENIVLLLFVTFNTCFNAYGQNCNEIREENKKLKQENVEKDNQIDKLGIEIAYFKEALDLRNSKTTNQNQDIVFKINSVEGNIDQRSIVVQGLIENNGTVSRFQIKGVKIIDPKGNEYKSHNVHLGSESIAVSDFQKDIPLKMSLKFESVKSEFPVAKALIVEFYNRTGFNDRNPNVIFKNLDVNWK